MMMAKLREKHDNNKKIDGKMLITISDFKNIRLL